MRAIPAALKTWDSALAARQLLVAHAGCIVRQAEKMEDGTTIGKAKSMKDLVTEY